MTAYASSSTCLSKRRSLLSPSAKQPVELPEKPTFDRDLQLEEVQVPTGPLTAEDLINEGEPSAALPPAESPPPAQPAETLAEVDPPAWSGHPSAEKGVPRFPLAEAGQYYIGLWCNLPNYGCPYCSYATIEGPDAVELHI